MSTTATSTKTTKSTKKSWLTAGAIALVAGATLAAAPRAEAGTSISLQIGTPYSSYYYTPAPVYGSYYGGNYYGAQPVYGYGTYYAPPVYGTPYYNYAPSHRVHRRGPDRDRDGTPDRWDRDRDGDGVPNRYDRRPDNPRRR